MPTSTPSPVFGNQEFHYTREDFQQVRERLYRLTGISLAESKAQLVYSRLSRRLRLRLEAMPAPADWTFDEQRRSLARTLCLKVARQASDECFHLLN